MRNRLSIYQLGAILSYFSIGLNMLGGLIFTPWIIQQIGKNDYGIYTLVMSLINLFLFDFGIGAATSRFVAKYRVEDNGTLLREFLITVYKVYFIIDIILVCIYLVIYINMNVLYAHFTVDEMYKLKNLFFISAVYSLISFPCTTFNGILNAYEKFVPLKMADIVQRFVTIVLTIIALLNDFGLYALVFANVISGLFSICIKLFFVKKCILCDCRDKSECFQKKELYREIFGFSLWIMVINLCQRLIFGITPTILGMVDIYASSSIAVFGIITTIEGYIYTITTSINGMFLTKITHIIQDDSGGKKLTSLTIKVGRFQYAINGLIITGFLLIGKEFLLLWMGKEFVQAYFGVLLVVFPGLLYNSLQIAHTTMVAKNLVKYQAVVQIVVGVTNVVLSFVFAKRYGLIGACLSIFVAYTIRILFNLLIIKMKINIKLDTYIKQCYIKMSVPFALAVIVGKYLLSKIEIVSWIGLILKGFIVVIIYITFLYFMGLSHSERKKVKKIIHLK